MNIAFVRGRLSSAPRVSELHSGDLLVRYELTVDHDDGPADTLPVVWIGGAAARPVDLGVGEEAVVLGRVRRRFWRSELGTRSATEIVADAVLASTDRRRVRAAARRVAATIDEGA